MFGTWQVPYNNTIILTVLHWMQEKYKIMQITSWGFKTEKVKNIGISLNFSVPIKRRENTSQNLNKEGR